MRIQVIVGDIGEAKAKDWDGPWSNTSEEWQNYPAVAAELGGKPRDNGFWMAFDDFMAHFVSISVCFAHVPGATIGRQLAVWPDVVERLERADGEVATARVCTGVVPFDATGEELKLGPDAYLWAVAVVRRYPAIRARRTRRRRTRRCPSSSRRSARATAASR
mgnify:CR=1 FL=1